MNNPRVPNLGSPSHSKVLEKQQRIIAAQSVAFTGRIKTLIYLYIFLWLIEGGLRRWFLPQLATPLLVIRDPIVLWIYYNAARTYWPRTQFIQLSLILGIASWCFAFVGGHGNLMVATYGVRCDFLHIPLIFIIGAYLRKEDLDRLFTIALWIAIPYTLLLILQFYSPQNALVNRGVGGDMEGAGFSGALGRFRPPGTFSFITGVVQFYTLLTAAWFYLTIRKRLSTQLLMLSGVAILLAIPVSISRSLFVGVTIVAAFGSYAFMLSGILTSRALFQLLAGGIAAIIVAYSIPATSDAIDVFSTRWERSTTNRGGVEQAIVGRVLNSLTNPFLNAPKMGYGTGASTQVGQKLLTGSRGFGYSEGEWGRVLWEGGLLLGTVILVYRLALLLNLTRTVFRAGLKGDSCATPLWAAAAPLLLIGQLGQSTTLGSTIIASGLCLAAASDMTKRLE